MDRVRKINIETLSEEDAKNIEVVLSQKLTELIKKPVEEANRICNVYGIKVKMAFQLEPMNESEKTESLDRELAALGETNG